MEGKSGAEGGREGGRGPAAVLPGSLSELYRLLCSCRGARTRERIEKRSLILSV